MEEISCIWNDFENQCQCSEDLCDSVKCERDIDLNQCYCDWSVCIEQTNSSYDCKFEGDDCICSDGNNPYDPTQEEGEIEGGSDYMLQHDEFQYDDVIVLNYDHDIELNASKVLDMINKSKTYDLSDWSMILTPDMEQIRQYGYSFRDLFISCSFNGRDCLTKKNFYEFIDPEFGKCFSFNHDKSSNGGKVKTAFFGSGSGLRLVLKGNYSEYINLYSRQLGIRVAFHEPDITPVMSHTGFNIKYNDQTDIALKLIDIHRIQEPWGKCRIDYSDMEFQLSQQRYTQQ
ncbi:degenerin-like protein asic-1, partial [Limulus polyphemus]|uniref:Degenerin-like protein asic-1 n=1 Tax=Limulus polyphemus TaxID=6850 RepID=A0ABM1BTC8_LIMPO